MILYALGKTRLHLENNDSKNKNAEGFDFLQRFCIKKDLMYCPGRFPLLPATDIQILSCNTE